MAGPRLPAGRHLRRCGHQLRALLRGRRARRAVPLLRPRQGDPGHAHRGRRARPPRLPADRRARAALRLPRARALRPGARPAVQPVEAARRPLLEGPRRARRVGRSRVRLPVRRSGQPQRHRLRAVRPEVRRGQPVLRLGHRPVAAHPLPRGGDLRGARARAHRPPPRDPRGAPRHLRGPGAPGDDRPPPRSRRHLGRADAGARVPQRPPPPAEGPVQLLGLQHHRLPGPPPRLRRTGQQAGQPGAGVQGDGARPARRGHRGDPRRRLQPHRRGQPHGPHAVDARHRQRGLLPARRGRRALLHGLHGHGQLAQRPQPAHAPADHGLVAVLGHRDARRRVPVRPGVHAGSGVLRRRPAVACSSTSSSRTR